MKEEHSVQDEISLKDFFLTIGRYRREIMKRWLLVALGVLIAAGIAVLLHSMTPKTYPAKLTFMVEDDAGGAGGMLGGLLGSFGAGLNSAQANLDRILSISKSSRIVNETMLKKTTVNGKTDFIGNHILEIYKFASHWKKVNRPELVDYRFLHEDISKFNKEDHLVLKHLYKHVMEEKGLKEPLLTTGRDIDAGILNFNGRTISPELTVGFIDSLYQVVSYYHEGRNVENAKRTYDIIKTKVDSISKELASKQYSLANLQDRSTNLISNRDRVLAERLQVDIQMLGYAYAEGIKNREMAALELESQKSNLLILDRPVLPIGSDHGSWLIKAIKGGIIGGIISVLFLAISIFYKDIMNAESK